MQNAVCRKSLQAEEAYLKLRMQLAVLACNCCGGTPHGATTVLMITPMKSYVPTCCNSFQPTVHAQQSEGDGATDSEESLGYALTELMLSLCQSLESSKFKLASHGQDVLDYVLLIQWKRVMKRVSKYAMNPAHEEKSKLQYNRARFL